MPDRPRSLLRARVLLAASLALVASVSVGASCGPQAKPAVGTALFASPATQPLALSADGNTLYVANTTSATVSVVDVSQPSSPVVLADVPVGLDPVGVAVRPKVNPGNPSEDELVLVTNYISDSISVLSRNALDVVQTVQAVDAVTGVTLSDEPTGVTFADPYLAFVTLDQTNEVLTLHLDVPGHVSVDPMRLPITAQSPRALTVSGNRLYVAAFESGNQTELPTCGPGDARGLNEADPFDEGCEFTLEIVEALGGQNLFDLGILFDFAAANPNIGGRVIRDRDLPDRDLFVFDLSAPNFDSDPVTPGVQPLQVVDGLGTLLYGIAAGPSGRVYLTNTEARNQLDGLLALGNRMFDNRLTWLDCAPSCGAPATVDLDASAGAGATVPTPYGVAVSGDGQVVVVTGAGSDGDPAGSPGTPPLQPELWGLAVLDANGNVLSGLRTAAIPQGVVLRSNGAGHATHAFVLNAVDSSLSVVDVGNPLQPILLRRSIRLGDDPTPTVVKKGRIHFMSARASTNGTFSCESCHPNGNMDQLLWVINAIEGPNDGPPFSAEVPEPRTTMPIRGLRDTLPLHWEGNLADPFVGTGGSGHQGPSPGCSPGAANEVACARHLVNASLSGVMCAPGACPVGPSALPGAFDDTQRNDLAAFLMAVDYPPMPQRAPSDRLSDTALLGVQDFFTNEDGGGINDGIGQVVNFAPTTCADNPLGCHSLPLTVSTNSPVVGGFDAPSIRGMVDRHILFSNGIVSSQEALSFAQDCANGILPPSKTFVVAGQLVTVDGDPCNLQSAVIEQLFGFPLAELPFPSGEQIYDPAVGLTERGSFVATFEYLFSLVYGVRGDRIWQYQEEVSTGLPGLTGRQVSVEPATVSDPATTAAMDLLEQAAALGKIEAVARSRALGTWQYDEGAANWLLLAAGKPDAPLPPSVQALLALPDLSGSQLRQLVTDSGEVLTLTAHLGEGISIGGADRQPLLDVDPDLRVAEQNGDPPSLPRPQASLAAAFRLGGRYVDPTAQVLINGAPCAGCAFTPATAATGDPAIDVSVPANEFQVGINVLQVLNPDGWASNEFPIVTDP